MATTNAIFDKSQPGVLRVFQSRQETKAFYNRLSGVYDLLLGWSERPVRRAGLKQLNAQPGEAVLEIGFGTGRCLVRLARAVDRTGKVYGLDLSDEMRKRAQANLERAGLAERVELVCGDAIKLPYQANTLDAVFLSFVLELFDTTEIPKVLAESWSAFQKKGKAESCCVCWNGCIGAFPIL
jgi:ubiquinone/menaquinone biosynthesis C-methylase UbiE